MRGTVLFVHGITEIGGAERELLLMLDRLPRWGYRSVVVCPGPGPLVDELTRRGIETRYAAMPPWRKLLAYPRRGAAVCALRTVIETERPALLHVNDIWWVPQTLRAVAGMDIPVLAHVRQEIEPSKVRRYELDRVARVLPVSNQIRRSLEAGGVLPARLETVYSGLDLSRIPDQIGAGEFRRRLGIPESSLVLGTVANLFARKGYEVMLRALPMVVKVFPHAHYLIVGTGNADYEARLREMVKGMEMEPHVHFAGFQDAVYPCLAAMDVYVHPALMEGFGIAVLEAMAMRRPVVATTTGGQPEIVQDGETGLLVPPGDAELLAKTVTALLGDPARRLAMGEAGRVRVTTHFTVEAMMERLVSVYGELIGRAVMPTQAVAR